MLSFNQTTTEQLPEYSSVTLSFDQRVKSRQKVTLDNGEHAGLFLARGTVLQKGDCLQAETGEVIVVKAAEESVSTVYIDDAVMMARACYHLGNRHVPLQISARFVRYQHDHVLDDMIRGLKLAVVVEQAVFEPEAGAYGQHSHSTKDGHGHAH
jgi:urease accessory protein